MAEAPPRRTALDRFVRRVEVLAPRAGEAGSSTRTVEYLPDGTTSVVFRWLGEGVSDLSVRGPVTVAHYKRTGIAPLVVRVVLAPGGAYPFFGVPMDRLAGELVPLEDLWGARAVRDRMLDLAARGGDAEEVVDVLREALVARLREAPFEPAAALAARAAARVLAQRERSVSALAAEVGLSERHLRRAFHETVGLSPKTFARIARFQRALALGRAMPGRWSEVALAAGYFDQPHLTAEFRRLARVSPGAMAGPERPSRGACS